MTGYLTKVRPSDLRTPVPPGTTALMIPNAEIKEIFESSVIDWFDDTAKTWNRTALYNAVWKGDCETITEEMSKLLRKTISYHDYKEDFYHAFLAGIFTGAGYMVSSNKEYGEGRSDVVIEDPVHNRVAIFEAKYSKSSDNMNKDCGKALKQIEDRMYAEDFRDEYENVFCYGISFFKKKCLVIQENRRR